MNYFAAIPRSKEQCRMLGHGNASDEVLQTTMCIQMCDEPVLNFTQ